MAGTPLHTVSTPLTASELVEQGFSPTEISQLRALRDAWNPILEQVDTLLAWRRMQFGKWLYDRGHFTEQVAE